MKKIFSCLLVVVMLAALLAVGVSAAEKNYLAFENYGEIAQVERKVIRLDGDKDELYDAATPISIATLRGGPAGKTTNVTGTAYVVYDSQYIWALVEVNDTTLNTHASDALNASYREDSVELLVDWANEGVNIIDKTPYQCRLSYEGYISARLGDSSGKSMFGSVEDGGTAPVTWLSGTAKVRADGTGYNCEFRIELPEGVNVGERIGINFMINDWTEQGGDRFMITSAANGAGEWNVADIGYMSFNGIPYTADMTIVYVVIALVAALAIGGATLVSLKKKAK